jgi:hypothetical protein
MAKRFIHPQIDLLLHFIENRNPETSIYYWDRARGLDLERLEVGRVLVVDPTVIVKRGYLTIFPASLNLEGPSSRSCASVDRYPSTNLTPDPEYLREQLTDYLIAHFRRVAEAVEA